MVAGISECGLRIPQSPFRNPQWVAGNARPDLLLRNFIAGSKKFGLQISDGAFRNQHSAIRNGSNF